MTSVLRFIKQRPADTQYFMSLHDTQDLSIFVADAQNPTLSYVSGAAAGQFVQSTVTCRNPVDFSGNQTLLFRDMGVTIVSSLRTFRRVQLLTLSGTSTGEWAGSPSGVFQQGASTEGVVGTQVSAGSLADSSFNVFYFETGANGIGLAQGLIRYG